MARAFVYIMASKRNGTLYIGVTSNLPKRVWEHKTGAGERFTSRYKINLLVWFEPHDDIAAAIAREKAIKKWNRRWKIEGIEAMNPGWRDLFDEIANN